MKTQTAKTYPNPSLGCYIDGANQNQTEADARVVRLAESFGMILDRDTLNFCLRVELDVATENDLEFSSEHAETAETWLNDQETRSFMGWYWNDGDFGLWVDVDTAREDCGFVSSRKVDEPESDYEGEWLHVNDHGNATLYVRENGKDQEIWSIV